MRIAEADILILPGLGDSSSDHWQRRWASRLNTSRVVEQAEWDNPQVEPWVQAIELAAHAATRPVILVAHSLACCAIAHAAPRLKSANVRGAFLVSPPDLDNPAVPAGTAPFNPVPTDPLPFPSMLVVSTNDPYCSVERGAEFAVAWGSDFHQAGESGHINAASGHGPWPEGLLMFTRLMQRLRD